MYYDLNKKKYIESDTNKSLFFLYNTFLGRMLLKIAITKPISNIYALYMNSRLSKRKIKKFISDNNCFFSFNICLVLSKKKLLGYSLKAGQLPH